MQKAVIFDIDGTLADNSQRQEILLNNKHDWDSFFSSMGDDPINKHIVELYNIIKSSKKYEMLIVSGRPEKYRKVTEQWLIWNNISFSRLYMRNEDDFRSDVEIKREILSELKKSYEISFVVDDRTLVVNMWREEGITCLQCYKHDF